jgi:ubiquinone/menaquinone biosynthesis C-methylase UbiE
MPAEKPTKEEVSRQFGRTAEAYARSAGHASGADLGILLKLLAPSCDMKVLDVATGTGFTAAAVAPFVREVVATDLVPEMIAQTEKLVKARGLANVKTSACDVEALSFADASFDAVTVRIAPHHFLDIEKALAEIARVLRPGGVFVMEDSCAPEARRSDRFINALEKLRDPTHVRSYTKREWKTMLATAGLKVVRLRNYRKQHDIADWVERSGLPAEEQAQVHAAFAGAPAWARKAFSIVDRDGHAVSYSDDKVILRALKG